MTVIGYGVAGEGLGHSIRAQILAEELLSLGHRIIFYVGANSETFLKRKFTGRDGVEFVTIPTPQFVNNKEGKISFTRTGMYMMKYCWRLSREVSKVTKTPDFMISDFEPISCRIAYSKNIPLITVDSQGFYRHSSINECPARMLPFFLFIRGITKVFAPKYDMAIISHFQEFETTKENVFGIGPILRKEVMDAKPENGKHILAYIRKSISQPLLEVFGASDHRFIVYGLGSKHYTGSKNIVFKDLDEKEFLKDLVSSKKVVTTAGVLLPCEARALGKPIFAIPEINQQEQEFNAMHIAKFGGKVLQNCMKKEVVEFLKNEDAASYRDPKNYAQIAANIIHGFVTR